VSGVLGTGRVGIHNLGHGKRDSHLLHDEYCEDVEEFKRVTTLPTPVRDA